MSDVNVAELEYLWMVNYINRNLKKEYDGELLYQQACSQKVGSSVSYSIRIEYYFWHTNTIYLKAYKRIRYV